MSVEAKIQEGKILTGKLTALRPIDETLTMKGYAADAKVVGDSIRASVQMDDHLRQLIENIDPHNADKVNYNNSKSGMLAANVQDAIDEVISRKPENKYYGNGSATERSIDIGGAGKVLCVYGSVGVVFVTPYGCFAINSSGVASFIPVAEAYMSNGVLTLSTTNALLNKDGNTYPYTLL